MTHAVQSGDALTGGIPPTPPGLDEGGAPQQPSGSKVPPLDGRRLLTAFVLTPLLAGFYPAIFLAEPSLMPLGLIAAYLSTVLFGVPLVYYFAREGYRTWWVYILGGAVCTLPTVMLYAAATLPTYLIPFGVMPVLGLLLWGASSGFVFWMIGVTGESPVSMKTLFDPVSGKD
jgi:hypothetical protein